MAFHHSNMGSFAPSTRDINGYVPEATDGPFDLTWDHGTERTHDDNGELTEYGEWWEEEGYPELLARAIKETEASNKALAEWQTAN